MLKIYNKHYYISINNGPWERLQGQMTQMLEEDCTTPEHILFTNMSFEDCVDMLQRTNSLPMYLSTTAFLHRDAICVNYANGDGFSTEYTNFNTISYKETYTENNKYSLAYIIEHFPAEQTIQYLKERGMCACACQMLNK
jgi:hypothetical protein